MKRQKRKKEGIMKRAARKAKHDSLHKMRAEQRMLGLLGIVLLVLFLNVYFYEGEPLTGYVTAIDGIIDETPPKEGKNTGIFILIGLFATIALFVFVKRQKAHP